MFEPHGASAIVRRFYSTAASSSTSYLGSDIGSAKTSCGVPACYIRRQIFGQQGPRCSHTTGLTVVVRSAPYSTGPIVSMFLSSQPNHQRPYVAKIRRRSPDHAMLTLSSKDSEFIQWSSLIRRHHPIELVQYSRICAWR